VFEFITSEIVEDFRVINELHVSIALYFSKNEIACKRRYEHISYQWSTAQLGCHRCSLKRPMELGGWSLKVEA
jgi:hypothetical protein